MEEKYDLVTGAEGFTEEGEGGGGDSEAESEDTSSEETSEEI